jgi:hypothetical protein
LNRNNVEPMPANRLAQTLLVYATRPFLAKRLLANKRLAIGKSD